MTYRTPSPPPTPKRNRFKEMLTWIKWLCIKTPFLIIIVAATFIVSLFYALYHDTESRTQHALHDHFVNNQQTCVAHRGWYVPDENYHGLLACRKLSDHSLFYIVRDTGLELVPTIE